MQTWSVFQYVISWFCFVNIILFNPFYIRMYDFYPSHNLVHVQYIRRFLTKPRGLQNPRIDITNRGKRVYAIWFPVTYNSIFYQDGERASEEKGRKLEENELSLMEREVMRMAWRHMAASAAAVAIVVG